ncbi:bifunctional [glutamate--ammonia ligase]-adenylyl-L-tyrosine phosphorylase/[glutamate--ammonia-ligase] adenylyltransferase [Spartinivicinus ruber]|uniref:bifunctional [glutamate--ammonia ligase]-adenylyl-L-tyrosine phosphorylase/[glutamate--ammonia-ligase] adenylyltransferase n=1 Tax=Spartinivicinus ruber TaxID=2683272 RepID=UPI0013D42704|nr:bifunctional [glutamate--ammonia ligase]-adenylyl-L-tyrosine phosphorylase/[glutamate--ammonia-ligase] adenylyltransferase [Spartinivicinus ruber]
MDLAALSGLPSILQNTVQGYWERFKETAMAHQLEQKFALFDQATMNQLCQVWAVSDYVAQQNSCNPGLLFELIENSRFASPTSKKQLALSLAQRFGSVASEADLLRELRQFRHQEMVTIIWRDVTGQASLTETMYHLSALADVCIDRAYRWLYQDLTQGLGVPTGKKDNKPQHMVVLGMGKLGACELNLSSDIDLMFVYPSQGETQGGRRSISNQEFFIRLGQRLIKALDTVTADGFAFRVDMRLRPYGHSGALALSFGAMEQYYEDQGRDWERYALIKARVVGGDPRQGRNLLERLKPFVYRRYLDFSAVDALRDMKQLIQRQVRRKGMEANIKLGPGGIREIEFIAQAFQLIHGGRDRALQQHALLKVLEVIEGEGYLPVQVVTELREAYQFLRRLEHFIQAQADQQSQTLPSSSIKQQRLALAMGYQHWEELNKQLMHHRQRVNYHFQQMVAEPHKPTSSQLSGQESWKAYWIGSVDQEEAHELFAKQGFQQPEEADRQLRALQSSQSMKQAQRTGKDRIDQFMPFMLSMATEQESPDDCLFNVLPFIESVLRRTAYLVLLIENPHALEQLLKLCVASPWIAETIAKYPMLLDELLDVGTLYSPPDKDELADELRQQLMRIPEEDIEQQMETLRYFKLAHVLQVAASEVAETLPLMKVSDYLTWIAEVVLDQVLHIAYQYLIAKHGLPEGYPDKKAAFTILGYGKVGGIELGHSSDLDLVFIYDAPPNSMTDGPKPIQSSMFYTRLGQRIIHILSTQTPSGQLYEVDMRLRPSGASGLLVSSLSAFEQYQLNQAWTWEHQALVRARSLAGSKRLAEDFVAIRAKVLGRPRELGKLRQEIIEMRQKMRDSLATKATQGGTADNAWEAAQPFDLKHDYGGIVDIEFMVQYGVLAWSHQHPELLNYTDNIRVLEKLEQAGLMTPEAAGLFREAYKAYRAAAHRLALQKHAGVVSGDTFHEYRRGVIEVWQQWLESTPLASE